VGHRKREEEDALGELGYSGSGEAPWWYEVQRHEIFLTRRYWHDKLGD
jgi:hypothetical protein